MIILLHEKYFGREKTKCDRYDKYDNQKEAPAESGKWTILRRRIYRVASLNSVTGGK